MNSKEALTIVSLDLEGTGLDTDTDRIIELGIVRFTLKDSNFLGSIPLLPFPDYEISQFINPGFGIPYKIKEITGITDDDVMNAPKFSDIAEKTWEKLQDCYIIGFNILTYDIPLLVSEFARCGIIWDPDRSKIIDTFRIYQSKERRDLQSALKFYTGIQHETSHRALDDAIDSFKVLLGQSYHYASDEELNDISKMAEFSTKGLLDFQKKFILNDEGKPTFNFGKSKGQSVFDNVGMLEWMLDKQFSSDTKRWAKKFIDEYRVKEKSELPF